MSRCIRTFTGHTGRVSSCAFSSDGSRILSVAADGLRLWDASNGLALSTLTEPGERAAAPAFAPDGSASG